MTCRRARWRCRRWSVRWGGAAGRARVPCRCRRAARGRVRNAPSPAGGRPRLPVVGARSEVALPRGGARHGEQVQCGDVTDVDDVPADAREGGHLAGEQTADDHGRSRPARRRGPPRRPGPSPRRRGTLRGRRRGPRSSGSTGCRPPSPARCGRSRRGPPTMREVAARFRCDPSTVSLAADKLQSVGLIARRPHPSDGRERTLVLTTAGTNCGRRSGHGCTPPASSPASTRRSSAPCRRCSPGCGRRGRATPPPAVPSFGNPFLRKGVDTSCGQGRGEWHCDTSEHARSSTTTTRRGRPGAGRHALGDTA